DNVTTPFNTQKIGIDVLTNDSDDSWVPPILTGALSNVTPGGTFAINATNTGTIDFTPTTGFTGSASTIYTIQDGSNNTATGLLTVAIECIQDACEQHLVAYAPYEDNTDIYGTWGALWGATSSGNIDDTSYEKYDTANNKFFDNSTDASTLDNAYLTNLWFPVTKLPNLAIYGWGNFWTGIFLDNQNPPADYLKYNLASLGLGNSFSIEMSVRGAALKRTSGYYYLFGLSDGGSTFNTNSLWFGLSNGTFWVIGGSSYTFSSLAISTQINTYVVNPNEFFRVTIYINTNTNTAQLSINDNILPAVTIGWYTQTNFSSASSLNVGWVNSNVRQWNDIIDFVKIRNF
ncbi:MAG: hypothetical protein ACD_71C00190G0001, partial [uncultured bacterium (gcode 4)]